jgi:hypothetical protein
MQFDIKGVRTRANGDHFPDFKLAIQHHGARLNVRQGLGA